MGRERHAEKSNLIAAVNAKKDSCAAVIELCNFMIETKRELNDTATGGEVLQNQGEIAAYKFIVDAIMVGPRVNRSLEK
jgi:hypothetical protein